MKHPVDILVGYNIKQMREKRKMSQKALAYALGISYPSLQKYESAQNRVSAGKLFEIANALQCPIMRLFKGASQAMTEHMIKQAVASQIRRKKE